MLFFEHLNPLETSNGTSPNEKRQVLIKCLKRLWKKTSTYPWFQQSSNTLTTAQSAALFVSNIISVFCQRETNRSSQYTKEIFVLFRKYRTLLVMLHLNSRLPMAKSIRSSDHDPKSSYWVLWKWKSTLIDRIFSIAVFLSNWISGKKGL